MQCRDFLYIPFINNTVLKVCEAPRGSSTRKGGRIAEQIIQKQQQTQLFAQYGDGSTSTIEAGLKPRGGMEVTALHQHKKTHICYYYFNSLDRLLTRSESPTTFQLSSA
jgi:hypothetical protein